MPDLTFEEFLPRNFEEQIRVHAVRAEVPFVIMRPDRGPDARPQPIAVVFGPCVPRVGEMLSWDNGELYEVIGVSHCLSSDVKATPYLRSLPVLATRSVGRMEGSID